MVEEERREELATAVAKLTPPPVSAKLHAELQHARRLQIAPEGRVELLRQALDGPWFVAGQNPVRHEMGISRDPIAHRAETLPADVLSVVAGEENHHRRDVGRIVNGICRVFTLRKTRSRHSSLRYGICHSS